MIENEIFNYLVELGCCYNCSVRYLNLKYVDFSDIKTYLLKNKYICGEDINDKSTKKSKSNPCSVCLGLLQECTIDNILNCSRLEVAKEYDHEYFTCSISMPACILIREHSMSIHLKEKFPEYFTIEKEEVPLNRAWKIFIKDKLAVNINKQFQNSDTCDFSINIFLDYEDDVEELKVLCKLEPKIFEERKVQHKKYNGELFSRKAVVSVLSNISSEILKSHTLLPPSVPINNLFCKNIECKRNSIYIAGRYCKYSRLLSQTPWIVDGVKTMETSVQEIIFNALSEETGIDETSLKFSSSGREDCDVRCLGRGRPFYIELIDPKKSKYSFNELRTLENRINESKLIRVLDLQVVERCELLHIKSGEEAKTKDYIALCMSKTELSKDMLEKLNKIDCLEIEQKTPIRVLHRRPLTVRQKTIHKVNAQLITGKPYLFELHVKTQAGTYVKEFVHGDFGRTTPNVSEILDTEVDIIALDVVAINLDWPKCIDYDAIKNNDDC